MGDAVKKQFFFQCTVCLVEKALWFKTKACSARCGARVCCDCRRQMIMRRFFTCPFACEEDAVDLPLVFVESTHDRLAVQYRAAWVVQEAFVAQGGLVRRGVKAWGWSGGRKGDVVASDDNDFAMIEALRVKNGVSLVVSVSPGATAPAVRAALSREFGIAF